MGYYLESNDISAAKNTREFVCGFKQASKSEFKRLCHLCVIYDINGRQEETLASFVESIRLNPLSAQAHYNPSLVYSRSSDLLDNAIAAFLRAIELDPTLANAHFDLGRIYEFLGQSKLSLILYELEVLFLINRRTWEFHRSMFST